MDARRKQEPVAGIKDVFTDSLKRKEMPMQHTIYGYILEHAVQLSGDRYLPEQRSNTWPRQDAFGPDRHFVQAALTTLDGQWWIDPVKFPGAWEYAVQEDTVPDWYCGNLQEALFRQEVQDWWKAHVIVNQELEKLESGFYYLKYCKVKLLSGNARVICQDTEIGYMDGNAAVMELGPNSIISCMSGHSNAEILYGNSTIKSMEGFSCARCLADYSVVCEMKEYSQIGVMYGNSTVKAMRNFARIGGVCDRGIIRSMQDHSMITSLEDSSVVYRLSGHAIVCRAINASIYRAEDFSCMQTLWGHSVVEEMSGRSSIQELHDNSSVRRMSDCSSIYALYENAVVLDMTDGAGIYEVYSRAVSCFAGKFRNKIDCKRFGRKMKDHWRIIPQKSGCQIFIKNSAKK